MDTDAKVTKTIPGALVADGPSIQQGVAKRVVLTGGPCGGKSTVQALLSDVFANLGWKVFRVPETATTLLSGGVSFAELSPSQALQFQKDLLLVMLHIEQTYFNLAQSEALKGHKAVVLCDRGCMDASAYIDKEAWKSILEDVDKTEIEIRDQRYDYVVHLVTAALGAESFYSNENNHVRSEGVELARELDRRCQQSWIGHPYYDIIDNSTDFDQKCHRVISSLLNRLGLEDKRYGNNIKKHKFLVDPSFVFDSKFSVAYQDFVVEHTFLHNADGNQVRIRRRTQNGVSHFNLTHRIGPDRERRRPLTGREYESLRGQHDPSRVSIQKKRRCFLWESRYFQLDFFESPLRTRGMMILEAYFADHELGKEKGVLPPFVPIAREITGSKDYSLFQLSLVEGKSK